MTKPEVRGSVGGVVRAAFQWKLLLVTLLLAVYTTLAVRGLYVVGLWTRDLLKDTILWFLFSGLALAFSVVPMGNDDGILRRALISQLKVTVLIEFLVNTYTFALPVELPLVLVVTVVAMLDVFAKTDMRYSAAAKLTTPLQAVLGLAILAFAIHQALSQRDAFETRNAFRALLLAPTLSILLIPYMYVLSLLSAYEQLFVRLSVGARDPRVARYAKRRLIVHLGLRPGRVRTFTRTRTLDLIRVRTRSDVDNRLGR